MSPTFKDFTIGICIHQKEYNIGNVIQFKYEDYPQGFIHRIVEKEQSIEGNYFYRTKGDNTTMVDMGMRSEDDIQCKWITWVTM